MDVSVAHRILEMDDPDDPIDYMKAALAAIIPTYMENVGCCPGCVERVEDQLRQQLR